MKTKRMGWRAWQDYVACPLGLHREILPSSSADVVVRRGDEKVHREHDTKWKLQVRCG